MPSPLPEPDLDLWREERTSTWLVLVPLVVVIATLIALVVIPHMITLRNAELRQELTEVLVPLTVLNAELERSVAAEAAAVRGYALSGDVSFADRFFSVHAYDEMVAADMDSISAEVGGEVALAAEAFRQEHSAWEDINFGLSPSQIKARLPEHQRQYEAVTAAAQRFDEVVGRAIAEHRQRIEEAYELRSLITVVLAIVALLAGGAALWLAYRLRRNSRHLRRRARDEAALRRIAQSMVEAEDLPEALGLIVEALAETARADGAHVEQVDLERDATVVVVATGEAPPVGERGRYSGSLAEQVIADGKEVRTGIEAVTREGRPVLLRRDVDGEGHLLIVPLLADGEKLGGIVLYRSRSWPPFDGTEAKRARLLADMAALVLQRMGHFDEVREKERALQETTAELRALTETLEKQVQERTRRVRELARDLTLAEQRERREIAQILHDDLQQVLFGLQLNLRSLETRYLALSEAAQREAFSTVHELLGETIASTRRLTVDLSPPILPEEGLVEALDWLAAHMQERFGLDVEVRACGEVSVSAEDMRSLLFQTIRELLFNVVKHAGTDRAFVSISEEEGFLVVEVKDEGVGFDASELPSEEGRTLGGFGLRRARERLRLFGGRAEVTSGPEGGTRALVALPLDRLGAEEVRHGSHREA